MNNNKKVLDDKYTNKIRDLSFQPIFIMGLHRSGTSILYKMLGKTGKLTILTSYHILDYDRLLYNHINNLEEKRKNEINNLFKNKGITNRKTDNIKVTADYAHEYVYIFSKRSRHWLITHQNKELFDDLCKKLKYVSENDNPILLKNPYDYANFLFIKKMYPNAKFIFIHRNPIAVINSMMNLWKTLTMNKNEYTALFSKSYNNHYNNVLTRFAMRICYASRIPVGIIDVIRRSSKGNRYFLKNIKYLSKDDYISVTYENLCKDPNKIITNIMNFLNLKTDIDFSNFVKPRNPKIVPEVNFMKKIIFRIMKPYFEYFKYNI